MALRNSHHNFEFSTQYHIYKWSRKIFQLPSCKMAGRTSFEMLENFFFRDDPILEKIASEKWFPKKVKFDGLVSFSPNFDTRIKFSTQKHMY